MTLYILKTLLNIYAHYTVMRTEIEKQIKKPKAQLTILLSYECFDKLEFLCKFYNKSRSQMIEACINTIYAMCVKEGVENMKKEVKE